jgi:beta-galactosidase
LVTYDRKTKKHAFYLYKAYLTKEPFVHLCGKRYKERSAEMTHVKVYSNLPEVSLYVNGALFETKKGAKVFEFLVPLKGKTHIEAVSREEKDEMTIEKVEKENPAYSSPTKMKVINWFEMDKKKEGYFSLDDKVADIKAHPVAGALYAKIMAEMTEKIGDVAKGFKMSPEMQAQMDQMSLKQTLQMAGHMVPPEAAKALAEALGKIKK